MKRNPDMPTEKDTTPIKVGVLMYTYNRTDDARINMEIIRNEWKKVSLLKEVVIVHCFNGDSSWWPKAYLENDLCHTKNPGHFEGAELLINTGMRIFSKKHPEVTHVVILASDTWCVKPDYVAQVVTAMHSEKAYLATSAWGSKKDPNMFKVGMSLDFSLVDLGFAKTYKMFPLRYGEFVEKYGEVFSYLGSPVYLERLFALRFKQAVSRSVRVPSENLTEKVAYAHIHHMREREPIHHDALKAKKRIGVRDMYWPAIGLITHHDPIEKQKVLQKWSVDLGEHGRRFLEAVDLEYFNSGVTKTSFEKNGKEINYND